MLRISFSDSIIIIVTMLLAMKPTTYSEKLYGMS